MRCLKMAYPVICKYGAFVIYRDKLALAVDKTSVNKNIKVRLLSTDWNAQLFGENL